MVDLIISKLPLNSMVSTPRAKLMTIDINLEQKFIMLNTKTPPPIRKIWQDIFLKSCGHSQAIDCTVLVTLGSITKKR